VALLLSSLRQSGNTEGFRVLAWIAKQLRLRIVQSESPKIPRGVLVDVVLKKGIPRPIAKERTIYQVNDYQQQPRYSLCHQKKTGDIFGRISSKDLVGVLASMESMTYDPSRGHFICSDQVVHMEP
jgi:hypothetical protein